MLSRVVMILTGTALLGCASSQYGQLITPDQVTWIQKGTTTRSDVLQRFGPPMSEGAEFGKLQFETTSMTETVREGAQEKSVTTTSTKPVNPTTIATYFYTRADAMAFSPVQSTSSTFWVRYDEGGVVQDFGFSGMPKMTYP